MADNKMSEIIRASIDGIRNFATTDTFIGSAIETSSGVTVIPVSRVSIGFATGGVDYSGRKNTAAQNFGGGGGSGISLSPIAFLTVGPDASVQLIPVAPSQSESNLAKLIDLVEGAPDLIDKIKSSFGKN